MCGIAGLLGEGDKAVVDAMGGRVSHRGPDDSGVFVDDGVSLAHRRLAILDPSHGRQPMTDPSGRYTLVYNGEVYNHLALRPALEEVGHRFETTTDSETILAGYSHWGPSVLGRLEGMYSLAIHDRHDGSLFVARDPWGIKPFFYARTPVGWAFASEQKALFAHPDLTPVEDIDRIKERAALEFLTGQGTLFEGVHQLPPGTWAHMRAEDPCLRWQMHYEVPAEGFAGVEEAARAIRDRFVASVREQMLSDVPLGIVLSGGLDSAAVAAVAAAAAAEQGNELPTFTIADSEDVPDVLAARRLAEHFGTDHHESFFDDADMWNGLPRWTLHNESINYTEFFFQPLFTRMREHVTVGLCGQGSDELWGGYQRYQEPHLLAAERLERLRRSRPSHLEDLSATIGMTHMSGSSLAEWDQQGQLANFQLRLVDRNSMACGLEVRVPFLSKPLHQASRAAPWSWKHREGIEKWVLRKAFTELGLPHDLLWRRKLPAGRATGPGVVGRFEQEAERLVDRSAMERHPLGSAFRSPAEFLVYQLWHAIHIEGRGAAGAGGAGGGLPKLEDVV